VDARGVLSSVSASDRTIVLSSPSAEFYVPEGTRVALDGAASGLSELSSLKGQKISLSAFAGGDGSVMVQSAPAVLHGTVRNIWDYGRYDAVSIELENGIRVTLVTGADSDVPGIRRNHSYDFISDGILILEMR
ncbi:MAG: hypothetical protein J6P71_04485, partial [Oscillospiraceae bacterium]|nr:hypothetical protein [Oscillospiraceae bacterium]